MCVCVCVLCVCVWLKCLTESAVLPGWEPLSASTADSPKPKAAPTIERHTQYYLSALGTDCAARSDSSQPVVGLPAKKLILSVRGLNQNTVNDGKRLYELNVTLTCFGLCFSFAGLFTFNWLVVPVTHTHGPGRYAEQPARPNGGTGRERS